MVPLSSGSRLRFSVTETTCTNCGRLRHFFGFDPIRERLNEGSLLAGNGRCISERCLQWEFPVTNEVQPDLAMGKQLAAIFSRGSINSALAAGSGIHAESS